MHNRTHSQPASQQATPGEVEGGPRAWIYHDVPPNEVRAAKTNGTSVTAPCGWTFTPMTPPTRPTAAGPQLAVALKRCPTCQDIAAATSNGGAS